MKELKRFYNFFRIFLKKISGKLITATVSGEKVFADLSDVKINDKEGIMVAIAVYGQHSPKRYAAYTQLTNLSESDKWKLSMVIGRMKLLVQSYNRYKNEERLDTRKIKKYRMISNSLTEMEELELVN